MTSKNYSVAGLESAGYIAAWQKRSHTGKVLPLFGKKLSRYFCATKLIDNKGKPLKTLTLCYANGF